MIMGSGKLISPPWIAFCAPSIERDREAGGRNRKRIRFVGDIDEAYGEGFGSCITLHCRTSIKHRADEKAVCKLSQLPDLEGADVRSGCETEDDTCTFTRMRWWDPLALQIRVAHASFWLHGCE